MFLSCLPVAVYVSVASICPSICLSVSCSLPLSLSVSVCVGGGEGGGGISAVINRLRDERVLKITDLKITITKQNCLHDVDGFQHSTSFTEA